MYFNYFGEEFAISCIGIQNFSMEFLLFPTCTLKKMKQPIYSNIQFAFENIFLSTEESFGFQIQSNPRPPIAYRSLKGTTLHLMILSFTEERRTNKRNVGVCLSLSMLSL